MKSAPILARLCLGLLLMGGLVLAPHAWAQTPAATASTSEVRQTSTPLNPSVLAQEDVIVLGKDFALSENEEARQVVVLFGSATIKGTVKHDVVVVGGSAKVEGQVRGNLVVILGSADLGPRAEVRKDVTVVVGTLDRFATTRIGQSQVFICSPKSLPVAGCLVDWLKEGLLLGRPLPPQFGWVWWLGGVMLLLYILLNAIFPQSLAKCVETLEQRAVGSFVVGLLGMALAALLLLLLAVSLVGLLIVPFLGCALVAAFLFGKVAVYRSAGQQLGRQFGANVALSPLLAVVVGAALCFALYMVPLLGFLVWGALTPLGFGAVVLAASTGLRREGNSHSPAPTGAGLAAIPPLTIPAGPPPVITETELIMLPRAGFWLRLTALLLDLCLFVMVGVLAPPLLPVILVLWWVYHLVLWTWKGTTIGGIVLGLRIVRTDGRPVDFATALVRSMASLFSAAVLFLGFFWTGWDRERQSWHDKIAGTTIVKMPKGLSLV